jgi:hypothetical protein
MCGALKLHSHEMNDCLFLELLANYSVLTDTEIAQSYFIFNIYDLR